MTALRISALFAFLSLMVAGFALGAPGDHRGGHGHGGPGMRGMAADPVRLVERMADRLDLEDSQRAEVSNIIEATKPELEALKDRGRTNRAAMRELDPADPDYSARLSNLAIESGQIVTDGALLFGRVRAEVYSILTPEQIAELEAGVNRWHERRDRRRDERE